MKNQELFNKTISILVKAYQNNTLEHFNCYACAVGNIIAGNCGYGYVNSTDQNNYYTGIGRLRYDTNITFENTLVSHLDYEAKSMNNNHAEQLSKTGYSFSELQKIEIAFESVPPFIGIKQKSKEQFMFDGLMAVCECLMVIHKGNQSEGNASKKLFVKA